MSKKQRTLRDAPARHPARPTGEAAVKVFVVYGATGEYSDHQEWVICGYEDEALAKRHVEMAAAWHRLNYVAWRDLPYHKRDGVAPSVLVGQYECDYSGTNFYYTEVEMRDTLPHIDLLGAIVDAARAKP